MEALSLPPAHIFYQNSSCSLYKRSSVRVYSSKNDSTTTSAHQLFDKVPLSDTVPWNNLIQFNLTRKLPEVALSVYSQMLLRGVCPDNHTFPRVITACRHSRNLYLARQLHAHALKFGFSSDHYVISALIDTYGRLDGIDTAKWLFDKTNTRNSVSWTMLAKLYLMGNKPDLAIEMFNEMMTLNVHMDQVALATAVGACAMLKSLQSGRKIHNFAKKHGLESELLVGNSLSKMYIDCDSLEEAREVFDAMPSKDVISWTEMVRGYVRKGRFHDGLKLFRLMNRDGIRPDSLSVATVLPACARMAAHKHGKEVHCYLLRNGIEMNLTVKNAIVDMYVKSGSIEIASKVFEAMDQKDVVSWTVMIMGYSLHGQGKLGVELFRKMEEDPRIEIDEFGYATVLHACCTARMVNEGRLYFKRIKKPKLAHYVLMVTLLARAGLFDEARSFNEKYGIEREVEVVRAVLDGCRIHQEDRLGKQVIEQLCELEPLNADNYVLLSNWYAEMGNFDMVGKLRETIRDMGLKSRKAFSWIEHRNKVHVFGTGDVSHPRSEKIYWELENYRKQMKDRGYMPNSDYRFHDVDDERECIKNGHSEMLAISFGLISTQAGTSIRVTKNLRVCRSCHDSAKFISKIAGREIEVKDPNCFHHFKDGTCSCGDIW